MKGNGQAPRGWQTVRLGELIHIKHGYAFEGRYFGTTGKYVVLTPGNFREEGGFKSKGDKEKFYSTDPPDEFVLRRGDLLVVMTEQAEGLLGSPAFVPKDDTYLHNQRLGLIDRVEEEKADRHFIYYLFNSRAVRARIRGTCSGVKVRHTSPNRIYEIEVAIPRVTVQRQVAAMLAAYDHLIENNTRRIQLLEQMARAIYEEWFVKFRFPGHQKVKMVKSELGPIPEGWEVNSLGSLCSTITDGSHWSPKSVDEGLPMASMKDMDDWGLITSQCRKISETDFQELVRNNCRPQVGDILVAKDGANYLKYIFVVEREVEIVLLSSIAILRPNGRMLPHLLAFHLREPAVKSRLANYVTGAAIPRIILKDFARFLVAIPPAGLQRQWWDMLQPSVEAIHCLRDRNANLRRTRDLLSPKLISGGIDVSNLEIKTEVPA